MNSTQTLTTYADVQMLARAAAASGLMPAEVKGFDAALYIMASGIELGLQPMVALRTLRIVKGRISIAAETMLALAISRGVTVEWKQADDTAAILVMSRPGSAPYTSSFTADDARKAGLSGDNWNKYRAAMLRARAISAGVRAYCPDVVSGLYTPEEVESFADDRPTRQPVVQIEARPAVEPMQIAQAPAVNRHDDAALAALRETAVKALTDAGILVAVTAELDAVPASWTRDELRRASAMLAEHKRNTPPAPEPDPAPVSAMDARRMKRIRECDAAGVLDATVERYGDPARWDHAACDAIKADLAALVSA